MTDLPPLPKRPLVHLGELPETGAGFLRVGYRRFQVRREGGELSPPFPYDLVLRERLDAVVVAAHFRGPAGERRVYLRSCLRPPVAFRAELELPLPEAETLGALWELPAGLVELGERSREGLRRSAARELLEEVGFDVDPGRLEPLGPSTFPAPGMIGERQFFFHVEVDPARRQRPTEDGSELEKEGLVVDVELEGALELARKGGLEDAKTELALRRLAELLEA